MTYEIEIGTGGKMTYGYEIRYGSTTASCDGCSTLEEARLEAIALAQLAGWTNPKWWHFWRWGDTRVSASVVASSTITGEIE
jgi:hypothetical protein